MLGNYSAFPSIFYEIDEIKPVMKLGFKKE